MREETFKPIPGFPGYFAGNLGTIKRGDTVFQGTASKKGHIRHGVVNSEGVRKSTHANRLVALAWLPPPQAGKTEAAHVNGFPGDNRAENIIWATPKENNSHKYAHGTARVDDKHPSAKLTHEKVAEIRSLLREDRISDNAIGRLFGVDGQTVRDIKYGRTWFDKKPKIIAAKEALKAALADGKAAPS